MPTAVVLSNALLDLGSVLEDQDVLGQGVDRLVVLELLPGVVGFGGGGEYLDEQGGIEEIVLFLVSETVSSRPYFPPGSRYEPTRLKSNSSGLPAPPGHKYPGYVAAPAKADFKRA